MAGDLHKTKADIVRGEFHTDGEGFVFTLSDTPFSGFGTSPQAAYDNLMLTVDEAADLPDRFRELAADQRSAIERASLIRMTAGLLIALTIIGGALGGALTLLPQVIADTVQVLNDNTHEPS